MPFPDPNRRYTPAEYFAIEAVAEEKSNYLDGRIFRTMTATGNEERRDHICLNIRDALQTLSGETLYKVSKAPRMGEPENALNSQGAADVAIYRAPSRPLVVFDVISPNTEAAVRGSKASLHRKRESVQQLVIVGQQLPEIEVYLRRPDECWSVQYMVGLNETLEMPFIGMSLPFKEIYKRVQFPVEPYIYT